MGMTSMDAPFSILIINVRERSGDSGSSPPLR